MYPDACTRAHSCSRSYALSLSHLSCLATIDSAISPSPNSVTFIHVSCDFCDFSPQILLAVKDGEMRTCGAIRSNRMTSTPGDNGANASVFFLFHSARRQEMELEWSVSPLNMREENDRITKLRAVGKGFGEKLRKRQNCSR